MIKNIIFAEEMNIFVQTKLVGFKISNKLQFCQSSVFSICEIALHDANPEIVNVVTIAFQCRGRSFF